MRLFVVALGAAFAAASAPPSAQRSAVESSVSPLDALGTAAGKDAFVFFGGRIRIPHIEKEKRQASAGGAAGAAIGWLRTPMKTDPLAGRVFTAESWRRKVKARQPVPLLERSPNILKYALVGYSIAEYALAYPTYGVRDSLEHVKAWKVGCAAGIKLRDAACERWRAAADLMHVQLVPAWRRARAELGELYDPNGRLDRKDGDRLASRVTGQ